MKKIHPYFVLFICFILLEGCQSTSKSYGPPINTFETVGEPSGNARTTRTRSTIEFTLSPEKPSITFWNDPETETDEWGTVTLLEVMPNKTVVIDFSGIRLKSKPNKVFPSTGLMVVDAYPEQQTAMMQSEWVHTRVVYEEPLEATAKRKE